jgi:hypothetical protein
VPAPRTLVIRDQFGDRSVEIGKLNRLCAPGALSTDPGPVSGDEYTCYRLRSARGSQTVVHLVDDLEASDAKVLRPHSLCTPASRGGGPLEEPERHFACYKIAAANQAPFSPATIALTSGLGPDTLQLNRRKLLCVPATLVPCATLTFTPGGGSPACGGPELDPAPEPPFAGALYDAPTGGNVLAGLGAGCSYFGGGESEYYPAFQSATGGVLAFDATACDAAAWPLRGTTGGSSAVCTLGPSPTRTVCLNDATRPCTTDADCPAQPGYSQRCAPAPRCFNGPPVPFRTPNNSSCVVITVTGPTTGSVTPATGELALTTPITALVYLDAANFEHPCPRCLGGICNGGARHGLACTVGDPLEQTSLDCPPFDTQMLVTADAGNFPLSTAPAALSSSSGLFCPGQWYPGAFGVYAARRIELSGIPAGNLLDEQPHPATLLSLGCQATTGDPGTDYAADFPGPFGRSTAGTFLLSR